MRNPVGRVVIGVDPHKHVLSAVALDAQTGMRELRDTHGIPPLPIRNGLPRSLPEPKLTRRTSHRHIKTAGE